MTKIKKVLSVSKFSQNKKYVPGIKVSGKYLNKLGFNFGDKVILIAEDDKIIIKRCDKLSILLKLNPDINYLIDKFDLVPE